MSWGFSTLHSTGPTNGTKNGNSVFQRASISPRFVNTFDQVLCNPISPYSSSLRLKDKHHPRDDKKLCPDKSPSPRVPEPAADRYPNGKIISVIILRAIILVYPYTVIPRPEWLATNAGWICETVRLRVFRFCTMCFISCSPYKRPQPDEVVPSRRCNASTHFAGLRVLSYVRVNVWL